MPKSEIRPKLSAERKWFSVVRSDPGTMKAQAMNWRLEHCLDSSEAYISMDWRLTPLGWTKVCN